MGGWEAASQKSCVKEPGIEHSRLVHYLGSALMAPLASSLYIFPIVCAPARGHCEATGRHWSRLRGEGGAVSIHHTRVWPACYYCSCANIPRHPPARACALGPECAAHVSVDLISL